MSELSEELADAQPTFVLIEGLPAPGLSKTRASIESALRANESGPVLEAAAMGRRLEVDAAQLDRAFARGATRVLVLREDQGAHVWLRAWRLDPQEPHAYSMTELCLSSDGPPNLSGLTRGIATARENTTAVRAAFEASPNSRAPSSSRASSLPSNTSNTSNTSSTSNASKTSNRSDTSDPSRAPARRRNTHEGAKQNPARVGYALAIGGAAAVASAGVSGVAVHIAFASSRSRKADSMTPSSNLQQQRYMFVSASAALVGVAAGAGIASVMRAPKLRSPSNSEIELTSGPAGSLLGAGVRAKF